MAAEDVPEGAEQGDAGCRRGARREGGGRRRVKQRTGEDPNAAAHARGEEEEEDGDAELDRGLHPYGVQVTASEHPTPEISTPASVNSNRKCVLERHDPRPTAQAWLATSSFEFDGRAPRACHNLI